LEKVVLGTTGLVVSRLIYGTLPLGPLQARLDPSDAGRLIRYGLEQGITMLDTAALYETYAHIHAALDGFRGDVVIATKTHAADAATARTHVETALRALGREQLEIVHIHGARIPDPFTERAEVLQELIAMRREGKIRHIGLSSHYVQAVLAAADHPEIEVIHPLINREGLGIIDGTAAEMAAAIAACATAGKGIYAMKALGGGNFISSARQSIRYVLGLHGVEAVAIGMLSPEEIDANIALFDNKPEDEQLWATLEKRQRRLAIMDRFCTGCGACVASCASQALRLENNKAVLDETACVLCGYCAAACPLFLIRVV
jgi:aryl-alcohol dehydrogenase-like predicted oxidoreductase